jgi:hypothetical protein
MLITLLHELVHVVQNLRGELNDDQRENEAYSLENELYSKFQVIKVRIVQSVPIV